jgi:GNAT superfamily N-acetyltransferase
MEIVELSERPDLIEAGIKYFWNCWGSESNFNFYKDCISHSLEKENKLPKFYLGISGSEIVASYALLTNDIISRQDLMPWLACLFVNEGHRGSGIAKSLLDHGLKQAYLKGFPILYLCTDLENFYERKGWKYHCQGFGVSGGSIKIYSKKTTANIT